MKKTTFSKIVASAFIAAFSMTTGFAQTNLGVDCGCPPVGTAASPAGRGAAINLSTYCDATYHLSTDVTLDCSHNYLIDKKIYVPSGRTLTIKPGTVVKGKYSAPGDATNAVALIIQRGGKIIADGTQSCPIVFAADADPLDGTFSMQNSGQWGGVVILGIAPNNITSANTKAYGGYPGVAFIEGFNSANADDLYGAGDLLFPTANPADNSGILRYVSIRNAGAIISNGNELNALSLGSVGSGTTIEHVETIASADDNFEMFGGTVNLKYCSTLFGDDDLYDWDQGWSGKAQFLFGMASDSTTQTSGLGYGATSDNGFEADADDNSTHPSLRSHPIIYNVTLIGNGHIKPHADNTGGAAIMAKELTEGEIYNSIFANYRSGLHLATSRSNGTALGDAYDNWTNNTNDNWLTTKNGVANYQSLKVINNTFIGFGNDSVKSFYITTGTLVSGSNATIAYKDATPASAADKFQFKTTDGNSVVASIPGFDYKWNWNDPGTDKTVGHTSYSADQFHPIPTANISSSITAPAADGFFSAVNFRGAFDANRGSWLSDWAKAQVLTFRQANPTDINNDGITNVSDYLLLLGKFNVVSAK
jgi:hypothetical protein